MSDSHSGCAHCGAGSAWGGMSLSGSGCASPACGCGTSVASITGAARAQATCAPRSPRVVERTLDEICAALSAHRRGYAPEWSAPWGPGDAGAALLSIVARDLEIEDDGLNAMPLRLQLEFLDTLGA